MTGRAGRGMARELKSPGRSEGFGRGYKDDPPRIVKLQV